MKKKLLYLLLLFSGIASAQIVNIPDINFKNRLLAANTINGIAKDETGIAIKIDQNNDYEIQESEALLVSELNVSLSDIEDMTGIEAFTNLKNIDCGGNPLINLDLTSLEALEIFSCEDGNFEMLNITGLSNLKIVLLSGADMESMEFSGLVSLEELYLLNMPSLINLELSDSASLIKIFCQGNDALATINLKNGGVIDSVESDLTNNPELNFICADENEIEHVLQINGVAGVPDITVSSYCSFTPGGDYNTITGNAVFDADSDGCGPEDFPYPFVKLSINDGTEEGYVFTNTNGEYSFYTQEGDFTVTPEFEDDWFTITPASVNFPVVDGSVSVQNFCIVPNGVHDDVEVVMVPIVPAVPGFDAVYKIVYKNKGNQIASGTVGCAWDYDVLTPVALEPMADEIGLGTYTWNYSNLQPFENREIIMTLHVNSPTDEPAVNINDVLPFTANINGGTDENPDDNEYIFDQTVIGAYDPNNIICIEGETASVDDIGNYLHYVVNFENTGTAAASFVVVKHIINETDFDIASLQVLNSSHQVEARITGNIIEFIFDNINLNAVEHGNILFKLKSKADLAEGDQVMNQANIYFDYNSPVETNEAITEFAVILGTGEFVQDASVKVYPNPATDMITVVANGNIQSVSLYDIQGRLLQTQLVNDKETKLNISDRQKGIYFLKITSDKGVKVEKVVKE